MVSRVLRALFVPRCFWRFLPNRGVVNLWENATHFFLPLVIYEGSVEKKVTRFLPDALVGTDVGERDDRGMVPLGRLLSIWEKIHEKILRGIC